MCQVPYLVVLFVLWCCGKFYDVTTTEWHQCLTTVPSCRSRGPWGPGPPLPQEFFLIMQFSGNFKGKTPILSKFWVQGPPIGVKTPLGHPDQNPGSAPGNFLLPQRKQKVYILHMWKRPQPSNPFLLAFCDVMLFVTSQRKNDVNFQNSPCFTLTPTPTGVRDVSLNIKPQKNRIESIDTHVSCLCIYRWHFGKTHAKTPLERHLLLCKKPKGQFHKFCWLKIVFCFWDKCKEVACFLCPLALLGKRFILETPGAGGFKLGQTMDAKNQFESPRACLVKNTPAISGRNLWFSRFSFLIFQKDFFGWRRTSPEFKNNQLSPETAKIIWRWFEIANSLVVL